MKLSTKIINLRALSKAAGVSEHKVYRRRYVSESQPLSLVDRTKLVNELIKESVRLSKELGFKVSFAHQESPSPRLKKELA
jgi:hypothetical protein